MTCCPGNFISSSVPFPLLGCTHLFFLLLLFFRRFPNGRILYHLRFVVLYGSPVLYHLLRRAVFVHAPFVVRHDLPPIRDRSCHGLEQSGAEPLRFLLRRHRHVRYVEVVLFDAPPVHVEDLLPLLAEVQVVRRQGPPGHVLGLLPPGDDGTVALALLPRRGWRRCWRNRRRRRIHCGRAP